MKKIYTLTTQYANNLGAQLQCYALCHYLNTQKDYECKVLDYYPEDYNLSWMIFPRLKNIKDILKNLYKLSNIRYIRAKKKKNKLMRQFIKDYIPLSSEKYTKNTIWERTPSADVFICGSDQIWNRKIFKDNSYFLDFVDKFPKAKRISYAASVADPWHNDFLLEASSLLKKFSAISIREKGNVEQVQSLVSHLNVQWVSDPVFLLSVDEWDTIARNPKEKDPYILCYFLDTPELAVKTVKKIRKITGLKVVHLSLNVVEHYNSDKVLWVHDPCDFIGYIKNAKYICTNSFHCSAFSIIFKKNFIFLPKTWANERVKSLQDIYKINVIMTKEKLEKLTVEDLNIDYTVGEKSGIDFIRQSKQFLINSINF